MYAGMLGVGGAGQDPGKLCCIDCHCPAIGLRFHFVCIWQL